MADEKMTFKTICPESTMDQKEGFYLFITAVWGVLILCTDYSHHNPLLRGVWISFGFLLILVSLYIYIVYCIYPTLEHLYRKFQVYLYLLARQEWLIRIYKFFAGFLPR